MEFDPLEGIRVLAVFVNAAGGQFQAGAGCVWWNDSFGQRLVQMTAQQQVAVLVDCRAGFANVEFGEVVLGVM